jgi:hypothetical protein
MSENQDSKRGGKRPGAGRPKGSKQLIAKQSFTRKAMIAAEDGETPLEYMLRVMRDPTADERRRDAMAAAAATYLHPKLSSVTGTFSHKHEPSELSDSDLAHIATSGSVGAFEAPEGPSGSDPVH